MANFFDQFDTVSEKEKEPSGNFFDQFDAPAKQEAKKEAPKVAASIAAPADDKEMFPLLRQAADLPLKTTAGVVTGVRMIADAFGADNSTGQNLRSVENYIADLYSAQSKKDSKEIARIMKEAEDKGMAEQVAAGVKAFSVAPADMLASALGTTAPAIAAGMAATLAGIPALAGLAVTGTVGALMGAGTIKGSIYDTTKQVLAERTNLSPKQIEALAVKAQEYGGDNTDQIALGAALGTWGASSGVEPAIARQIAKGVATKEATKLAIKEATKKETAIAAERGMLKHGAITGGKEFIQEGLEGGQEQAAQNIALQRMGFDVPTMQGVYGQATLEGMAGLGMGKVTGMREAAKAKRELAEDATKGTNIAGAFTTAREEAQRAGVGFDQESADLVMPASDATGTPLVGGITPPPVTVTTPAPPAAKKIKAEPIKPEDVTPESVQAASDYVAKVDSGEAIKQSDYRKIATSLGVKIPFGTKNAEGVELIRQHLAQRGAPNVAGTDTQAGGAGAGVAALTDQSQTATGTAGPQPSGVVSTGTNAGPNLDGTIQQPVALTPVTQNIIKQELSQGVTPAEIVTKYGTTPELATGVDSFIKSLPPQGITSGTTTPEAKQAETQGQTAPTAGTTVKPAGSVSLGDLAPEIQDDIMTRRDNLYEMETGGASQKKIAAAYKALNTLEQTHGLDLTKPSTLSAKRTKEGYLPVSKLIKEGSEATATTQETQPAYQGTDLQAAMELGDKYEKQEEQEKQKAYEESLGKGDTGYLQKNIPADAQEQYEQTAEEIKQEAVKANETRSKLAEDLKRLTQEHKDAEKELDRLEDEVDAAERKGDQRKLDALREEQDVAFEREGNLLQELTSAQTALQEHGPVQTYLPAWDKLNAVDKDIYFENVKYGNRPEHREAGKKLRAYFDQLGRTSREGEGKMSPAEQRVAKAYEDNRKEMGKLFGVDFPAWNRLSNGAKAAFLREIVNSAGQQQDRAFAKLGVYLVQENKQLDVNGKQKEIANIEKRQEEVRKEAEENQKKLEKLRADFNRTNIPGVPGTYLPNSVVKMVQGNDLKGVLQYLRSALPADTKSKKMMKTVAQALFALDLKTQIKYVESLSNGDLAQYDPATDTIYVTAEGMTAATVLHEIVHAGTAKIINLYTTNKLSQLTEEQIRAVEQLEDLMYEASQTLRILHPYAFEVVGKNTDGSPRYSIMEFLAYAMTDESFQDDLNKLESQRAVLTTNLPEAKSGWSKFKLTIAKLLGVDKIYFRQNKTREDAPFNFLLEVSAAFDEILAKPTEPIYLSPLAAKAKKPAPPAAPKVAEEFRESGLYEEDAAYKLSEKENPTKNRSALYRMFTTREGWRNVARKIQDKSYASRSLHNKLARAKLIKRDISGKFNNFDEQGDLATGEARQFLTDYLQEPLDNVRASFQEWIKLTGQKTEKALEEFHKLAEMFHEPERRNVKWVTSVPLSTKQNLMHNGKPISAAERRIAILGDQRTGKAGLIHRVELTKAQKQALWQELTSLANNHADPLGDSPRISEKMRERFAKPGSTHKGIDTNKDAPIYNVLGIEQATVNKRMAEYMAKSPEERAAIEKILAGTKVLSDATAELNKIGNYWSMPVSNIVGMYDYQHYMPFKGISKHSIVDDLIDPERSGKELQEQEHAADGRFKTSDNPILQLINDAYRSAGRAGRRNYTQSIKNAIEDGSIPGKVVKTIKFEERNTTDLSQFKGGANIFHYNPDGSIDILRISDPKILNALRYSFRDASPMLDFANSVTGFFGAMHTRYNYNFAPLNFVRDTLTNSWNIGASRQLGPLKALQYLNNISVQIVKNGLGKAMEVALLEEKGDAASKKMLLDAAAKDPFVANMLEYLRFGGKTTYLQGFSLKSNLEQLSKNTIGRSRIITNMEDLTRLIDCWNNMFEFTGRAAAYSLYKEEALKRHIADGLSNAKGPQGQMSPAEIAAAWESAAWVKNLANFEKVGELGRGLGSAYMFIRPSATGAVRAVEAVMPAFMSEKSEINDMPPQIANNPVAKAEYLKSFQLERRNAQIMIGALMGVGYSMYLLSMLGAPDDEWKRNNTKTDNMEQWTRFARFHLPNEVSQRLGLGKDVVFQSPWGFGLGSFAAIGAQIGGMIHGSTSIKEGLGNIVGTILPDSFLPLPMSKIPITDSPLNWLVDSIAPTVLRPIVEFISNKNGIGQAINSAAQRRMGDAFTGSDRIPEVYKDVAKWWFRTTGGEGFLGIPGDISPNTIYFFANSYLDGISKIGELTYNWASLDKGEREFNPKNDVPLFGSFFGAKTNVDSREYGKIEEKIKEISKRLVTMKQDDPVVYANYIAKHPLHQNIVDVYQSKQGELNALRQKATEFRNMKGLSPKQRDQVLKVITLEQNMLKHQMVMQFNAMGMEP